MFLVVWGNLTGVFMFGMGSTIKLGRVWDIPIGLHWSWFVIFVLVTGSLSAGYFPSTAPGLSTQLYWILGTLTSLAFFLSILVHEFGHALVAKKYRIVVQEINLFVFGGAAHISREPETPQEEFNISIAGPAASLAIGLAFGAVWWLARPFPAISTAGEWLARINLVLVVFNLLPGFPLDGGRVFHAILWWFTGNVSRASRFAGYGSQLVAFGFIGYGIFSVLGGNIFNGIWLVMIGWFLESATSAFQEQTRMHRSLGYIKVGNVMGRNYQAVTAQTPIAQIIAEPPDRFGRDVFFVLDRGRLVGMLTAQSIASVAYSDWRWVNAGQIMTPIDHVIQVHPETDLLTAMTVMEEAHQSEMPVIAEGKIAGLLSRDQLLHFLNVRRTIDVQ